MKPVRDDNKRIKSVYLDKTELAVIEKVALANGQSPNAAIRILVRKGLGLPAPELRIPAEVAAEHGLQPTANA